LFRLLAQDLDDQWSVERISDHICALADRTLKIVLDETWALMPQRHREDPQFAIIAYGKLGGKELGYASDLDLIFIYDDEDERAAELYSRLATRFSRWISAHTPAGVLFDTDYRLRPNGQAGLLVSSFAAFKAYQRREGGVGAWLWEHQALTRARFCVGDAVLGAKFEEERKSILQIARDWSELRAEVLAMRERMHQAQPAKPKIFDLKLDVGGMVDIEFIVQTLVLRYSQQHASLTENKGNIALLKRCAGLGLIDSAKAYACANIYRSYRAEQHALRLAGNKSSGVDDSKFVRERLTVVALWNEVFRE
jgi:glutamate-ammonia-ligase adenylyltransferase